MILVMEEHLQLEKKALINMPTVAFQRRRACLQCKATITMSHFVHANGHCGTGLKIPALKMDGHLNAYVKIADYVL